MKTGNYVKGKYFASSMKDMVYPGLNEQKTHGSTVGIEPRLSIYGRHSTEWNDLATWWLQNEMSKADSVSYSVVILSKSSSHNSSYIINYRLQYTTTVVPVTRNIQHPQQYFFVLV